MTGFRCGGAKAYGKALRQQYEATLRALRERLGDARSQEEKSRIRDEIARVKAELRKKLAEVNRCLF